MPPLARNHRHSRVPARSAELCSCDLTRRAARALTRLYSNALSDIDLTVSQLGILREAFYDPAPTFARLGETMVLDRTSLHRALAPMVRNGWLDVSVTGQRRQTLRTVSITPAGRQVLAKGSHRWNEVQRCLAASFGQSRWDDLQTMMAELTVVCLDLDGATA